MLLSNLEVKDRAGGTGGGICDRGVLTQYLSRPCFLYSSSQVFFPVLHCFKIHCIKIKIFVSDDTMEDIYVFSFLNIFLHNFFYGTWN